MGRTRPPRNLPPLSQLLPNFAGLPPNLTQPVGLRNILRELTDRLRQGEPVTFYSMREIGAFFHVPLPTVAQVYRELEAEGRITRLRGAYTLLLPKRHQPHTPVRGVVGVPLWEPAFCEMFAWRLFFRHLEARLRHHYYVADAIFFWLESDVELFAQLVAHQLDYVVWLRPLARHKPVLQQLADAGTISAVLPEPGLFLPAPTYLTNWENAFRRALAAWRRDGVTAIDVLLLPKKTDPFLMNLLDRQPFRITAREMTWLELRDWVARQTKNPSAAVMFADDHLAEQFIARYPDVFAELARRRRVLLKTTIPADAEMVCGCRVDLLAFDWEKIASKIADDIASGQLLRLKSPVIIPAKLHLRADAAKFAQRF